MNEDDVLAERGTTVTEPVPARRAVYEAGRLSRRTLCGRAGVAAAFAIFGAGRAVAAHAPTNVDDVASVELPPSLGQSELTVYVAEKGHTLSGVFLDYWRANGAASLFGNPVSEPFAAPNGYYSQAFERGILQYQPEYLYTTEPVVRLMPIGRLTMLNRLRRSGDWRAALRDALPLWLRRNGDDRKVATILDDGGVYVETTGHTISGEILAWYAFNEGGFYLGPPLSEPTTRRGVTSQWFDGGLIEARPEGVALAALGATVAEAFGVNTAPARRSDLPLFDELLFWDAANPNPLGDPYAPGGKWVEVNVAEQRLTAYQGTTPLSATLVSTGLDPNPTEIGMFRVRLKYPVQDMKGFTSATGEVIAVGDEAAPSDAIEYSVADVPHVLYFNMQGEALHGTYWHSNFGERMSHGCVNLPLDFAAWLYGWAPLGTGVWVHE
jgi:hypothetical protein